MFPSHENEEGSFPEASGDKCLTACELQPLTKQWLGFLVPWGSLCQGSHPVGAWVDASSFICPAVPLWIRQMLAEPLDKPFLSSLAGYELLFQPEVVRIYISLLKESKTPAILEASAGAIQNLCAGSWTVSAHGAGGVTGMGSWEH